jgi:hypothetical protein
VIGQLATSHEAKIGEAESDIRNSVSAKNRSSATAMNDDRAYLSSKLGLRHHYRTVCFKDRFSPVFSQIINLIA